MLLPGRILPICAIGAALIIAACGSGSTHLSGGQAGEVGGAVGADTLALMDATLSLAGGPGPILGLKHGPIAAVVANPITCVSTSRKSTGTTEDCTIASTTLNCTVTGTATASGTFSDNFNTETSGIDTVNLTGMKFGLNNCEESVDTDVIFSSGNITVTSVSPNFLELDTSLGEPSTSFEVLEKGHVNFKAGPTDTRNLPRGGCDVNFDITFTSFTSGIINKATTFCGQHIAAGTPVSLGTGS